jgi:hypothetical protein
MVTRAFRVSFVCLFLSAAASAQSTKLNGELAQPVGGNVTYNYEVTPDGSGPAVRLSGPEGDVPFYPSFVLSPDGTHVAYYADISVYFVSTDESSSPIQLDTPGPGASMGDTDPFFRLASNDWLVFWNEGEGGIWSAPTAGGTGMLLSSTARYVAGDFLISPDAARVFFRSKLNFTGLELFSMASDGSGSAIAFGSAERFRLTPDGSRVVYQADQAVDGVFELYSVLIDGTSEATKLNGPLFENGLVDSFEIGADSRRVVFLAHPPVAGTKRIYSVPITLTGDLIPGGFIHSFALGPFGRQVAYVANQETQSLRELYRVPILGNHEPVKLNGPVNDSFNVFQYRFSPRGNRVVYRGDQETPDVRELYSSRTGKLPLRSDGPTRFVQR